MSLPFVCLLINITMCSSTKKKKKEKSENVYNLHVFSSPIRNFDQVKLSYLFSDSSNLECYFAKKKIENEMTS